MGEAICEECVHFRQHYVLDAQSAMKTDCGHCVYPRIKRRRPRQSGCTYFMARTEERELPDRRGIIHFLTTEVMQHILNLPLPPEIK